MILIARLGIALALSLAATERVSAAAAGHGVVTVILSAPEDPYRTLAEEISRAEGIPLAGTLEHALQGAPEFMIWVVAPSRLSDRTLVDFAKVMLEREPKVSVGIISGSTAGRARELWRRAPLAGGRLAAAVTASNPSGNIPARIMTVDGGGGRQIAALNLENLLRSLRESDYWSFTGHGGGRYLRLDPSTVLRTADVPVLEPVVVATASCNTFRIWEPDSIALAFTDRGAAAYAGFAYSPVEGYLIGEFDGLPFRHTWPEYPVGHVVQVQNQGTLKSFARLPFYFLLGDPRISLRERPPYRVVEDRLDGDGRILRIGGAPAGYLPVRIPAAAGFGFVEVSGGSAAWERAPFYDSRLQMANIGEDKYLLLHSPGGEIELRLKERPAPLRLFGDILTDVLDHALLYGAQTGGGVISLAGGLLLFVVTLWRARRRSAWSTLFAALLTAAPVAALYVAYALARLDDVTITSKVVRFSPAFAGGVLLLTACGAFIFLSGRSLPAKALALVVPTFPLWAPGVLAIAAPFAFNQFLFEPMTGAKLYSHSMGQMYLASLVPASLILLAAFHSARRLARS